MDTRKKEMRCMDDILGVNGICFGSMVGRVCPSGPRLGGANASGAGATFLDLHLSISSGVVSAAVCDRPDSFGFGAVNFPFLDHGL